MALVLSWIEAEVFGPDPAVDVGPTTPPAEPIPPAEPADADK